MRILISVLFLTTLAAAQETIPYEPAASAVSLRDVGKACEGAVMASVDSNTADFKAQGIVDRTQDGEIVEDPRDPSTAAFARAGEKMMAVSQRMYGDGRLVIALISSSEINAWSLPHWIDSDSPISLVCIPTAMAKFVHNEDELAFVIGHEIGHTVDADCRPLVTTASTARGNKALCELRADEIGYNFLWRMGYDGYAAAGYFGRWEMYSGEMQTGLLGSLHQALMDHPITPKRIENMRRLLLEATKQVRASH
jgi:predicted Zn-dependent protease